MKLNSIILLLTLLINYSVCKSQCSFSYSKDICDERDASYFALELWNGDFIVGGGGACGANPELTVLSRINCNNEVIWYRIYPENNAYGLVGKMYQIDSNVILVAAGDVSARIFKIDINSGELIQDKYKFIPNNHNTMLRGGANILIHNGYIYSTIIYEIPDSNNFYFLMKMDLKSLEILWFKKIIINNLASGKNIVPWNLFISGNQQIGVLGYITNSDSIFMHTLDTSANLIKSDFPFNSMTGSNILPSTVFRVNQSIDKKKLLMRLRSKYTTVDYIAKIDTSGTIDKYIEYDDLRYVTQTQDGGYVVCGRNDLIRKLDSNFQTIYQVKSKWPGSDFYYINEAQDGGLFATGMAGIFATDGDMAFIKAEPHGGINSVQEVQDLAAQIQTSPNPATTQVHITSPVKLESYTINNTSGTQVQSGVLENDNNIDISQLPQGLYFLQLQLENGQRVTKKLVRSY